MSFKTTEEIKEIEEMKRRIVAAEKYVNKPGSFETVCMNSIHQRNPEEEVKDTPPTRPVFESIYSDFMKKQANLPGEVRTPLSTNSHMSRMRNELLLESKGCSYLTRQVSILNGFRCGVQIDFDEMGVYHLIITHPTDKQKQIDVDRPFANEYVVMVCKPLILCFDDCDDFETYTIALQRSLRYIQDLKYVNLSFMYNDPKCRGSNGYTRSITDRLHNIMKMPDNEMK
jgi:hypothetical protein